MSGTSALTTNSSMPSGGWIMPIPTMMTTKMPNQIGSMPACTTIG